MTDDERTRGPGTGDLSTPQDLAHQIYDQAVAATGGDTKEASVIVMRFLTEALVYSAGVSCGGDEVTLAAVLKHLGKMISEAPAPPIIAAVRRATTPCNKEA